MKDLNENTINFSYGTSQKFFDLPISREFYFLNMYCITTKCGFVDIDHKPEWTYMEGWKYLSDDKFKKNGILVSAQFGQGYLFINDNKNYISVLYPDSFVAGFSSIFGITYKEWSLVYGNLFSKNDLVQ